MKLTQDDVRALFDYDSNTGNLIYKVATRKNAVGNIAGTKSTDGIYVGVGYSVYRVHRLIWLWHYGDPVPKMIDHKDNDPFNNRLDNLRSANDSTNSANSKMYSNNKSGVKGVSWSKVMNKWEAYVWYNYKKYNLGYFSDIEEAKRVRQAKFIELFGEYARHE